MSAIDEGELRELLEIFLLDSPRRLDRIERELAAFERAEVGPERIAAAAACEHEAHSLNGAASTLHLDALAALAEELELTCHSLAAPDENGPPLASARDLLTRIEKQFMAIERDDAMPAMTRPETGSARCTVLQVEDNPVNAGLIERALAKRPEVRVITATSAETGLCLARDEQPDLILLDLHLPDASGEEFLGQLRLDPTTRDLVVVITTAEAYLFESDALGRLGVHGYLTKPVDIARLLELVDELASTRGVEPAGGRPKRPTTPEAEAIAGPHEVGTTRGERDQGARMAREIVEAAPHGIALLDLDGLVLDVNPATERLLDYSRAEIVGNPCQPFTHPDDHAKEEPLLEAVLRGASDGYTIEKRYLRRGGEPVWARLDLRLIRDEQGEPLRLLALIEDISERRQADEQIRTILECITDGFVALDPDWRYTYVNERAAELFGRTPEDLIGRHIWDEFPEGVGQPFHHAYEKAMAEQTTIFLEDYYEPWDRWFENRIYGSRNGIAIYFTEITERKRIEEAERRQRERAEALRAANEALTRTLDLEQVLGVLLDSLVRFVPHTSASVLLVTEDSQLAVGALRGYQRLHDGEVTRLLDELRRRPLVRGVLEEGRTVIVEDSRRDPDTEPLLARGDVQSWVAVPLCAAGQVIGLCTLESDRPNAFREEDVDWTVALITQAAAAIENARLHDQLQRHAAELERRVDELAEAQRVAHIGSFEWDIATDRVSWSDELYRIYGLDRAEFAATFETFVERLHPDDREAVVGTIQRAVAEGESFQMQERIVRPSGEVRHLSTWGEVVRDEHGRPARLVGICHDVTEQRRQRERGEALRVANEALTRTLDLEEVLGVLLDSLARFVPYTSASVLLVTDDSQLAVGALRGYEELDAGEAARLLRELRRRPLVRQVLEEGRTVVAEDSERELEGKPLLASEEVRSWIAVPLRAGGQVIGLCALESARPDAFRDEDVDWAVALIAQAAAAIENARLHDQLQRHAAELEQRIADRTQALREAKDEAERANRAKSMFLAGISHELRTPMNAILGYGQLLEMDNLTHDQADSVQQILRAGHHLLQLITELLDIARIEAGQLALSVEPISVEELVVEAVDVTRPLGQERGVKVFVSGEIDGYVLADRQRLLQVLLNLLGNAVKYNRYGGSAEVTCTAIADDRVAIAVRDTGHGIDAEDLERLFVPFDRLGLEGGTIDGAGLGLALVKRLVEVMDGTITVASRRGLGSTFTVTLPAADDPLAAVDAAPTRPARRIARAATILYIEDNLANLHLVERALARQSGVKVLAATQGRLGIELALERRPDLVLLDLHLPDITGEEVVDELAAHDETARIPVVVVSAAASRERAERLRKRGVSAYLTKPIDLGDLLEAVDVALEPRG